MKELLANFFGSPNAEKKRRELEKLIADGSAEAFEALGEVFIHSANKKLSRLSIKTLIEKSAEGKPEAQDSLCRLVIEYDQAFVRELVQEAGYAPGDPHMRAVFYFLTGQWERYDALDFEQKLLTAALPRLSRNTRQRLNAMARSAGRIDFISALTAHRHSKRLENVSEKDWRTMLEILRERRAWGEMWQLVRYAPPLWSLALLLRLKDSEWKPQSDLEQCDYEQLLEKAMRCAEEPDEMLKESVVCTANWLHPDGLSSLAVSPDGQMLAVGSFDATVFLYRLPEGTLLHRLKSHTKWVNCLAFSQDNRLLISGAFGWQQDTPLRVWEVPEGRMLYPAGRPGSEVMSIAVHPNGNILAYAGRRGRDTIGFLALQEQGVLSDIAGLSPDILALVFSPDGQYLFSGNAGGRIHAWTVADWKLLYDLGGHTQSVDCLAVSPDSRLLASSGRDTAIHLGSVPDGRLLKTVQKAGGTSWVKSLAFSPDGSILASGSHDRIIRLWSVPDGKLRQTISGHEGVITGLTFSPEGDLLLSCSSDRRVRLWDVWKFHARRLLSERAQSRDLNFIVRVLEQHTCNQRERNWLEFIKALLHWQQRFDIELVEHPHTITLGEFDIEIT